MRILTNIPVFTQTTDCPQPLGRMLECSELTWDCSVELIIRLTTVIYQALWYSHLTVSCIQAHHISFHIDHKLVHTSIIFRFIFLFYTTTIFRHTHLSTHRLSFDTSSFDISDIIRHMTYLSTTTVIFQQTPLCFDKPSYLSSTTDMFRAQQICFD